MWLVGYTAAWMLFRRGWIFWSLALPGGILLVTLALDRERPSWPALLYLGFALALAAGHTAIVRSAFWRSRAISQPSSFGRRSIVLGGLIAALAVGTGLYYSFDLDDRIKERAVERGDQVANWVTDRFDPESSGTTTPQPVNGNYGAFSDQFKVGDGVPTGDTPLVVVQANGAEYLAARRMNDYDGVGWRTITSATGADTTPPSRIAYQSDQAINIPRDQQAQSAQEQASLVLLQPTDRLLFTIDQHFSASVPTLVRVGWEPIDTMYEVGTIDLSDVPVDLRELVLLLQSSQFTDPATSDVPQLVATQDQVELERIQTWLQETYPVASELSWGENGEVQVQVTGRLPVYAEVEAVFSLDDLTGDAYSVVGLVPQVSGTELASASGDYPAFIADRYLSLPETVTQETRDLATQIAMESGATTPFDQAVAIQNYLRTSFTYQLDAGGAPDGRDIVDYFLFESKVGRCDHYASSMAVMLRMLGVPTRIVTGLAPVPFDSEMNGYVYRGRNAHSWVEVYFPGYGWIQFEPTPTEQAIDLDSESFSPAAPEEPTPTPVATSVGDELASPVALTPTPTPLAAPAITDTEATSNGSGGISPVTIGLAAGAIALFAGAFLFFWKRRNAFMGMPVARANYGRLQRLGRFMGIEATPELTPREYASRFGIARPQSAAGALQVADAFTQEQYATNGDAATIARESEHGWREAKEGTADWRFWRRR